MTATLELAPEMELEENVRKRAAAPGVDRIVLTGFMGSGKTSVGRVLAERLGWRFLDLDAEIERRNGRTVPQVFAESGESHFRHLETAALAGLLGRWSTCPHLWRHCWTAASWMMLAPAPRAGRCWPRRRLALQRDGIYMSASQGTTWRPQSAAWSRPRMRYWRPLGVPVRRRLNSRWQPTWAPAASYSLSH